MDKQLANQFPKTTLVGHLLDIFLFILLLTLLLLTPQHPWVKWQWPCFVFCVAALFWSMLSVVPAILWIIKAIKAWTRGKDVNNN